MSDLLLRSRYTRPILPAETAPAVLPAGMSMGPSSFSAGMGVSEEVLRGLQNGAWMASEGPRERGEGGSPQGEPRVVPVFVPVVVPVYRNNAKEGTQGGEKGRSEM